MAIINAGTKSISSFLKDDCYYVPQYQRNYAWSEYQWEDLWLDLMELYQAEERKVHFFGQVVLHADEVIQVLNTLIISDEEFYQKFKLFEVKRTHTIRYLLRMIHSYHSDEMRTLNNNQEIHIEHILPKILSDAAVSELAKNEQESLINRFGKLTLLEQEYNCQAKIRTLKRRKNTIVCLRFRRRKIYSTISNG